jgi:hypothetical protein
MQHMFSSEILEQFRAGKREFRDIHTQFCDIEGFDLSGIVFRDSTLEYTSFRSCNMKGAKFINCDIYFFSLCKAGVENVTIDKCRIDTARLDDMRAKNMKITNSHLSWCVFMGTSMGEINLTGTSEFKCFRSVSDITDQDAADLIQRTGAHLENLSIEIKLELEKIVKNALKETGQDPKLMGISATPGHDAYGRTVAGSKANAMYGAFDKLGEALMAYGASEAYKQKHPYEQKDKKKRNY